MYAEEAAYMDLGVFYNIVLPLFEMLVAVLIMISTPGIIFFKSYVFLMQYKS